VPGSLKNGEEKILVTKNRILQLKNDLLRWPKLFFGQLFI
jgi:hypothetical protein